ncbi:hypothetical protein IX307_001126 [Bacteroides pyogenes]|uniref:hypothetical protein n=1 Tax=Bacteroides pyogenes TaxID=310300 RepID=UPI001BA43C17|nr:hypothetical protein [Bacteroides pyogenes]MBR8719987.1 hypothetical protein [Bacteroides pyogenes]MBR8786812.1 hypothetical protein [Bacteroides pyogenes]MBR8792297.1 hypothetical protein [Bacteroides pyogenes]
MKHFASHYLYLPGTGFLKQQVITVSNEGFVEAIAPLTHEVESVEWIPGVIALFSAEQLEALKKNTAGFEKKAAGFEKKAAGFEKKAAGFEKKAAGFEKKAAGFAHNHQDGCEQSSRHFQTTIKALKEKSIFLYPCVFYPFDFTSMQPVAGTRHKLLR